MLNLHSLFVPFLALAGLVGPGWLGVFLAEDDSGRPSISEVVPDSPAAKAGIKPGDVIVALDETATDSLDVLVATVAAREAGSKIKVKLLRDGKQHVIEVELGQRPTDQPLPGRGVRVAVPVKEKAGEHDKKEAKKEDAKAEAKEQPKTGLAPRDVKPSGKPFLGVALVEEDGGVQVTDVLDGSPASQAGLDKGRLISIAGTSIKSLADVDKVMSGLGAGQSVKIAVRASNATETVDVKLGAAAAAPSKGEGREVASGTRAEASEAAAKERHGAEGERAALIEKARAENDKVRAEAAKIRQQAERKRAEQQEAAKAEAKEAKAEAKESTKRAIAVAPQPASDKVDVRAALRDLKGKQPALLVFGAAWDSSTKALKKSLGDDKVKSALGDRKVVWIDTDQHGQVADEFGVQQIPHMVLLDASGKRTGVIEGFQPAEILVQKLSASADDLVMKVNLKAEGEAAPAKKADSKPAKPPKPAKPAPERDLQEEVRALREEIRELRGMLQELMRERRR